MEHALVTSAIAQGFMKKSLQILRAKTTAEVYDSAIQMPRGTGENSTSLNT